MKQVEEELTQLRQQQTQLEEEEQKLEKDNVEVKHELEKYDNIVKDNQAKVKHWNKEVMRSLAPLPVTYLLSLLSVLGRGNKEPFFSQKSGEIIYW